MDDLPQTAPAASVGSNSATPTPPLAGPPQPTIDLGNSPTAPYTTVEKPSRRKYFLIVAALIILLAVAGTVGYFWLNLQSAGTSSPTPNPVTTTSESPLIASFDLVLNSPTDETVVNSNKLTVDGKTAPFTTVVFYTEKDQNSVESDGNGQFSGSIALSPGINSLVVSAYGNNGEEKTVNLSLVYDI